MLKVLDDDDALDEFLTRLDADRTRELQKSQAGGTRSAPRISKEDYIKQQTVGG